MQRVKNIVVWLFIALALVAFYISLRTDEYEMEAILISLGLWGISFLANRYIKTEKD